MRSRGAALVAIGFLASGRPSIYRQSSFWTSSPTWFAIRVGIMMIVLSIVFAVSRLRLVGHPFPGSGAVRPLEHLGRSSLFVYWIHVELVYGYASWLWRHRLPLWGTVVGYIAFCTFIYRAVVLRDRLVAAWRARRVELAAQPARQAKAASEASA